MAAPRAAQTIAFRNIARSGQQIRSLHMTGPATYASHVLTSERPVSNLPSDLAGLRAECKRRKIDASGSQQDLISRLNAHEFSNSRAFSTAVEQSRRKQESAEEPKHVRHFNTSRTLKAVHDSSTIDFAFLPALEMDDAEAAQIRVPLISSNYTPARTGAFAPEVEEVSVMKPEISTMSLDSVYLPMSDMSDGHSLNIDFHAMADKVATNVMKRLQVPKEEQASLVKQIWNDMVDDLVNMGKKRSAA